MMSFAVLLISNHRIQIHILHAAENVHRHIGIILFQIPDQFLDLGPLGSLLRTPAGSTALRKTAGTLDKM